MQPGSSAKLRNEFLNEASIMGQFQHDHVIKLYGVVTKVEPAMIVMEFMDNGSLYSYLRVSAYHIFQVGNSIGNRFRGNKFASMTLSIIIHGLAHFC